jgi:hypothetical protein
MVSFNEQEIQPRSGRSLPADRGGVIERADKEDKRMATREASGVLSVEMEVTRYQEYPDDNMVQVWGYVGDYEIAVYLPASDPRLESLLGRAPRFAGARPEVRNKKR